MRTFQRNVYQNLPEPGEHLTVTNRGAAAFSVFAHSDSGSSKLTDEALECLKSLQGGSNDQEETVHNHNS